MSEHNNDGASLLEDAEQRTHEFWLEKWRTGETLWRQGEAHAPFAAAIYSFIAALHGSDKTDVTLPLEINETEEGYPMSGAAELNVVKRFLHKKRVLVPLCGDSKIVSFVLEMGASSVVGCDISAIAIESVKQSQFHHITFDKFIIDCQHNEECYEINNSKQEENSDKILHHGNEHRTKHNTICVYRGKTEERQKITLYEGNFLQLLYCPGFVKEQIDFVYDRGALIAVRPIDREAYMNVLACVLTPDATALVIRPIRSADDKRGPPFAITNTELHLLYSESTHRNYTITETAVLHSLREQSGSAESLPYSVTCVQPVPLS